jgi:hypothetical protein
VEQDRDLLRELSARLLALHKLLLDRERQAYEERHGPADANQMLRLLLHGEQFAWLRPLSKLVAQMDDLVDSREPVSKEDAERTYGEAFRLLGSGDPGVFQEKYRDALQASPDVVMAHASIRAVLRVGGR